MDRGKVAGYTEDDSPGDLPLITDLYAPKEYYNDDDDDPAGALPGWFLSTLGGSGTTFATLRRAFDQLTIHNWSFVAKVDRYCTMDEQFHALNSQIDLLEQETHTGQTARMLTN